MRRTWIVALAVLLTSIFTVIWIAGGRDRKVPEPPSWFGAQAPAATEPLPPKKIAREVSAGCVPLPEGAFSCGACRDDADCPPSTGCIINLESGRTECETSQCTKSAEC